MQLAEILEGSSNDADFDELVDGDGPDPPRSAARLRRVHEMLVAAGPPPELPRRLEEPDAPPDEAEVLHFPLRRRLAVTIVAAAAMVIAGFGGGFFVGHSKSKPESFVAERVVSMHGKSPGPPSASCVSASTTKSATGRCSSTVRGLPTQAERIADYELWLAKDGKPAVSCGTFRVHDA